MCSLYHSDCLRSLHFTWLSVLSAPCYLTVCVICILLDCPCYLHHATWLLVFSVFYLTVHVICTMLLDCVLCILLDSPCYLHSMSLDCLCYLHHAACALCFLFDCPCSLHSVFLNCPCSLYVTLYCISSLSSLCVSLYCSVGWWISLYTVSFPEFLSYLSCSSNYPNCL